MSERPTIRPNRRKVPYGEIVATFNRCGNVDQTAAELGISRTTVNRVLRECVVTLDEKGEPTYQHIETAHDGGRRERAEESAIVNITVNVLALALLLVMAVAVWAGFR